MIQSATSRGPIRIGEGGDDRVVVNLIASQTRTSPSTAAPAGTLCNVPNLNGKAGTFWTDAELGGFGSYVGADVNKRDV